MLLPQNTHSNTLCHVLTRLLVLFHVGKGPAEAAPTHALKQILLRVPFLLNQLQPELEPIKEPRRQRQPIYFGREDLVLERAPEHH